MDGRKFEIYLYVIKPNILLKTKRLKYGKLNLMFLISIIFFA